MEDAQELQLEMAPVQAQLLDKLNEHLVDLHKKLKTGLELLQAGLALQQRTPLQQQLITGLEQQLESGEDFAAKLSMSLKFKKATWDGQPFNQASCLKMLEKAEVLSAELTEQYQACRVLIPKPE